MVSVWFWFVIFLKMTSLVLIFKPPAKRWLVEFCNVKEIAHFGTSAYRVRRLLDVEFKQVYHFARSMKIENRVETYLLYCLQCTHTNSYRKARLGSQKCERM